MPMSEPEAGSADASANPNAEIDRSNRATASLPSQPTERSAEIGCKTMLHGSGGEQLDERTRLVQGKRRRKGYAKFCSAFSASLRSAPLATIHIHRFSTASATCSAR